MRPCFTDSDRTRAAAGLSIHNREAFTFTLNIWVVNFIGGRHRHRHHNNHSCSYEYLPSAQSNKFTAFNCHYMNTTNTSGIQQDFNITINIRLRRIDQLGAIISGLKIHMKCMKILLLLLKF